MPIMQNQKWRSVSYTDGMQGGQENLEIHTFGDWRFTKLSEKTSWEWCID